jgi:hypothetical protein
MYLQDYCFYSIFAKKRNSHDHFKCIKKHKIIPRSCCFSAIMTCLPQKYLFSIEIEISAIVISHGNCSDKQIKFLESIHNSISKMKHSKIFKFCLVLFFISFSISRGESNSNKKNQKKSLKYPQPFEAQYIH